MRKHTRYDPAPFVQFESWLPPGGFRLRGKSIVISEGSRSPETVTPFWKRPNLPRELAYLEPTPEAILEFANQVGALRLRLPDEWKNGYRESLESWRRVIAELRGAVELLADKLPIKEYPIGVRMTIGHGRHFVRFPNDRRPNYKPNLFAAQSVINEWLKRLASKIKPSLMYSQYEGRLLIRMRPVTLEAALWMQLATTLQHGETARQCLNCSKVFSVFQNNGRSNRKEFCGGSCRVLYSRREKRKSIPRPRGSGAR